VTNSILNGRAAPIFWSVAGIAGILGALTFILDWTVVPLKERIDKLEAKIEFIMKERLDRAERGPK
jgi:hypothetical protein